MFAGGLRFRVNMNLFGQVHKTHLFVSNDRSLIVSVLQTDRGFSQCLMTCWRKSSSILRSEWTKRRSSSSFL
jgi:hypothetical protein